MTLSGAPPWTPLSSGSSVGPPLSATAARRPRRRQPHSWHVASGYGTLVEGEETKSFETWRSGLETKYQENRRLEGYKTLVEEDCKDLGLRKEDSIRSFNLKYQDSRKKVSRSSLSISTDLSIGDSGSRVVDKNSVSEWLAGGATETETVADSAVLLEPRARRLATAKPATTNNPAPVHQHRNNANTGNFLTNMPGIKNLITRRRESTLKRRDSCSLARLSTTSSEHLPTLASSSRGTTTGVRKCETVLALTGLDGVLRSTLGASRSGSTSVIIPSTQAPLAPVNRLRTCGGVTTATCSRCSSLLSLQAATGSRYSLNSAGFISVCGSDENLPAPVLCKLCLAEVPVADTFPINQCNCSFCKDCMRAYVEFEIAEGAYDISCPDAQCPSQGVLQMSELDQLVTPSQLEKHKKYRLNREVDLDKTLTWCPRAGCETVCSVCPTGERCSPQPVHCPTCISDFCSNCKLPWHTGVTCEENSKRLAKEGKGEDAGIPFDSDLIKCCPMCNVPIEKDEGCAQMMCKRCKHVFCWYCLASLDDDFLLRHYDKGPCKNKLGHSRASVIWHRTQVIGIFAGFGILLLVASPLLLLAAPCIVCCKCRVCNAGTKLENEEDPEDSTM